MEKRNAGENPFLRLDRYNLEDELNREMPNPGEWLNDRELRILAGYKKEVLELFVGCEKKGGFTPEAAEFYDRYSGNEESKALELFKPVLDDMN